MYINPIGSTQKNEDIKTNISSINSKNYISMRLHAIFLGYKTRKHLRVKSLSKGLINVRICGDKSFFNRIKLQDAFIAVDPSKNIKQELYYVVIDKSYFRGNVFADPMDSINPTKLTRHEIDKMTKTVGKIFACINGGFFNHGYLASTEKPTHASIGKCINHRGEKIPYLPVPEKYKSDYKQIIFENGSLLQTAPPLSCNGVPTFTETTLLQLKYHQDHDVPLEKQLNIPGYLNHASSKHPRAAISLPSDGIECGRVRLVIGLDKDRKSPLEKIINNTGYTLVSWSKLMARIDQLEKPANSSINLDGGGSTALVIQLDNDEKIIYSQYQNGRAVSNLIGFIQN